MNANEKVVGINTLKRKIAQLRKRKKTIAFTNGCFDLLHYGHVNYLQSARKKNRILIIGLNSDSSVRRIKGAGRPIVAQQYRAKVLAALSCVDFVTIFSQATPLKLIKALKPGVLIKGADWKGKEVVGAQFVRSYGGKVELVKYLPGLSTSKMVDSIVKSVRRK